MKHYRMIGALAMIGGGFFIWWFTRPEASSPQINADPNPPTTVIEPALPVKRPAPVARAVVAPAVPSNPPQPMAVDLSTVSAADADLINELHTTVIPHIASLLANGDGFTVFTTYMSDRLPANIMSDYASETSNDQARTRERFMQSPQIQQAVKTMGEWMEQIRDLTPTYDSAKQKATYAYTSPDGSSHHVTFTLVNGQWKIQ